MPTNFGFCALMTLLLGCSGHSCKPDKGLGQSGTASPGRSAPNVRVEQHAPIAVPGTLATLLRSRRFDEALEAIDAEPYPQKVTPAMRFIAAFAALRARKAERVLLCLANLEEALPTLAPDVKLLRAEAQLLTKDALAGAAFLASKDWPSAWVLAAESLERQQLDQEALSAVQQGLSFDDSHKSDRAEVRRARLRSVRIRALERLGRNAQALEDLRWLSATPTFFPGGDALVEQALASKQLVLSPEARLTRLTRLAERGQVEAVERELSALGATAGLKVSKLTALYLRGVSRRVSRRKQTEGAEMLTEAAELGHPESTQLQLDAARMWVREGDAAAATKLYLRVSASDKRRSEEALYYAARTEATIGDPQLADLYYSQLLRRFAKGLKAESAQCEQVLNWLALGRAEQAYAALTKMAADSTYRGTRGILLELSGVAAEAAGKTDAAIAAYRAVINEYSVQLPGLFARQRLRKLGVPADNKPNPAQRNAYALDASVSARTRWLSEWGLDELSARSYREEEAAEESKRRRSRQAQCANWAAVSFGPRGFALSSDLKDKVKSTDLLTDQSRWAFDCRFPTPYSAIVSAEEAERALPSLLTYAIMKQESGFDPEIVSPANARGLLQLLDETARRTAVDVLHTDDTAPPPNLFEPRENIRLGAAYMRRLLDLFGGNLVLTVAAYNAGPKAVTLWARHATAIPMELFAARIPYNETRGYVDHVLSNLGMYRYLQGGESNLPEVSLELPKEIQLSEELY